MANHPLVWSIGISSKIINPITSEKEKQQGKTTLHKFSKLKMFGWIPYFILSEVIFNFGHIHKQSMAYLVGFRDMKLNKRITACTLQAHTETH